MKPIIVFGSINIDLVAKTPRLPVAGETLQGYEFFTAAGGKGANQAVAAARLGASALLVGRVGDDEFGHQLRRTLQQAGVSIEGILVDAEIHSGVAVITVDDQGENQIITVAGANGEIDASDVERLRPYLKGAAALLLQFEIPVPAVQLAARAATEVDVPVIVDPAPVTEIPDSLYPLIDIITPNQVEASQLVGFSVHDGQSAAEAASVLRQRGVNKVIVKLGDRGVVYATESETVVVPAFAVKAVDTVAAGDAFNGALAVALAEGLPLHQAVVWGSAAGALSVTQAGAQPSLPARETLEAFLHNNRLL